jgi:O-glycosyl hydrolase
VKILPGEVANTPSKYVNLMNNDTAASYVDIVGYHIYDNVNNNPEYTAAHDKGKETWMTEHIFTDRGNRFADPQWSNGSSGGVWSIANEVHHVVGVLNSSAFNAWWIKRFYGLIGDDGLNEGGGNRDFNYPAPPDGQPTWRGYALSHFAKFAKETRRVKLDAEGFPANTWNRQVRQNGVSNGVHGTAYKTEDDNSISLVFYNQARVNYNDIQIDLPADFVARSAWAIITTSSVDSAMSTDNVDKKIMEPHPITLLPGRQSAVLSFPGSCIISVKFVK